MAAATPTASEKNITIRGRLSFPKFTHAEALENARKSTIAAIAKKAMDSPNEIPSEFNLLIERPELDKLKAHIRDLFVPYSEASFAKDGAKGRDALDPKIIKKILDKLDDEDWDGAPYLPIKTLTAKNQESAPEAVASVKVTGPKGGDVRLEATVFSPDQLVVPDENILKWPVRRPITDTVFQPYPGAYFVATLNLFSFNISAGSNGISAGANVAFYMGNVVGERFGGGVDVDEDAIFLA